MNQQISDACSQIVAQQFQTCFGEEALGPELVAFEEKSEILTGALRLMGVVAKKDLNIEKVQISIEEPMVDLTCMDNNFPPRIILSGYSAISYINTQTDYQEVNINLNYVSLNNYEVKKIELKPESDVAVSDLFLDFSALNSQVIVNFNSCDSFYVLQKSQSCALTLELRPGTNFEELNISHVEISHDGGGAFSRYLTRLNIQPKKVECLSDRDCELYEYCSSNFCLKTHGRCSGEACELSGYCYSVE